jgi:hypothetical protein
MGHIKRGTSGRKPTGMFTGLGRRGMSTPVSREARAVLEQRLAEAGRRVAFGEWIDGACAVVVDGAAVARLRVALRGRYVLGDQQGDQPDDLDIGRHSSPERAQDHVRRGIAAAIESGKWEVKSDGTL